MRPIFVAAFLLSACATAVAARVTVAEPRTPLPVGPVVTCWHGSEGMSVPAERVRIEAGGLRFEYKGRTQLTSMPCISRTPIDIDPPVAELSKLECIDHAGIPIYSGEVRLVGISDGVFSWFEDSVDLGYTHVLSTAHCRTTLDFELQEVDLTADNGE